MLLDTTFLIDIMRADDDAVDRAQQLEADLVQQRLSAMTLFELFYGVARSNQREAQRETVESVISTKPVQPADNAVMRKAGRLAGELASDGRAVGDGDRARRTRPDSERDRIRGTGGGGRTVLTGDQPSGHATSSQPVLLP